MCLRNHYQHKVKTLKLWIHNYLKKVNLKLKSDQEMGPEIASAYFRNPWLKICPLAFGPQALFMFKKGAFIFSFNQLLRSAGGVLIQGWGII